MKKKLIEHLPQILGLILSANAGAINAISLVQPLGVGVSHATGSVSHLSMQLVVGGEYPWLLLGIIGSFLLGAMFSGLAISGGRFNPHRRYGLMLIFEAALIFGAARLFLEREDMLGLLPLALACGMQNGLFTSHSRMVIRTTHLSGVLTDLGLALGRGMRTGHLDWTPIKLYLALLGGFVMGGLLGMLLWTKLGNQALEWMSAYVFTIGMIYFIIRSSKEGI